MRRLLTIAAICLATPVAAGPSPHPPLPFKGWSGPKPEKPPCECRYKGGKAALGQTICQSRGERMVTLRCELVLNNTSWKEVREGCDTSYLSLPPISPF